MTRSIKRVILCFITWLFIVLDVYSRVAQPEVYDVIGRQLAGRSREKLPGSNRINLNNRWYVRERKKIGLHHNSILTIQIQDEDDQFIIEFEKVDHHLANEHLPIWMTSAEYPKEYEKMHNDGVINRRYFIRKLPMSKLHQVHKVNHRYVFVQKLDLATNDDEVADNEETMTPRTKEEITNSSSPRGVAPNVFPELLIAVGYDMFMAIEQDSKFSLGVETVSHLLVTLNAVDMLYESVNAARIYLNIAGVVIEASEDRWDFVKSLAIGENIGPDLALKSILDAENITSKISDHFKKMERYFPRDSYDFIIYNTRNQLTYGSANIMGIAWHAGFSYMYPAGQDYDRINFATQDHKSYAHFVVMAHEIAHMMNVEHDPIDGISNYNLTLDSLMSCHGGRCVHGLSWSEASEETFHKFFRSPAHCMLRNPPRSLYPPKPRKTLTVLEQCQCNGFNSFRKPNLGDECNEPNMCLNDNEKNLIHVTQLPMDGTPCGNYSWNYVCWEEKCIHPDHWIPHVPV